MYNKPTIDLFGGKSEQYSIDCHWYDNDQAEKIRFGYILSNATKCKSLPAFGIDYHEINK